MLLYAFTSFLSAFLLFQLQPMIAKIILPWFGGTVSVWITCLLFFQLVLMLGYLYAHVLIQRVPAKWHAWGHVVLLAASILMLPVFPNPAWKPAGAADPAFRILLLLAVTIGLPYLLLSSTTPLLQAWYTRTHGAATPYWLFSLSNAGSLLGLLSYPFLVEPFLSTRAQATCWSVIYTIVAASCALTALRHRRPVMAEEPAQQPPAPDGRTRISWVALAACGSALLLAVTNHVSQNVAAVPFLWVGPLSLYLMSFILCFGGKTWYRRDLFLRIFGVGLAGMAYALAAEFVNASLLLLIPLYFGGLFVSCMVCHGELARLKPHPAHLTAFYLMVSLGGALGGLSVGLVAPNFYQGCFDLPIVLGATTALVLLVLRGDPQSGLHRVRWRPSWLVLVALAVALIVHLSGIVRKEKAQARVMLRNFYGCLRVVDLMPLRVVVNRDGKQAVLEDSSAQRKLLHGTIDHGLQFLAPEKRRKPTGYYGETSGVGLALREAERQGRLRVGLIGLGPGTLAAYGHPGDVYIFYEINPLVVRLANTEFTFLRDSAARVDMMLGDARLSLERQPPQNFDVLAVDAFSGDAIPVHLMTREAFLLYFRHLKPSGVLALHVSNRYLDLEPVVQRTLGSLGKRAVLVSSTGDERNGLFSAYWILASDRRDFFEDPEIKKAAQPLRGGDGLRPWTDDYSDLLRALRR